MRKIANVKNNSPKAKRVVIYETENEVYLFSCASLEDGSGIGDQWYEIVNDADAICLIEYGIEQEDWEYVDDPLEYCLHDWIAPVRIKGTNLNKPEWENLSGL